MHVLYGSPSSWCLLKPLQMVPFMLTHADSCLPSQMLPFMLTLILLFLVKCVFITIVNNKKVQFASLFRLSCLLAENLLIFEKVRFCHEISSILSPRTYKLLFNGLTNSKSVFCIFTAIISAFCWCMVHICSLATLVKHSATPHFGDFALYYRWDVKILVIGSFWDFVMSFCDFDMSFWVYYEFLHFQVLWVFAILSKK